MFINLHNLIIYMDSYSNAYLNISTYEILYEKDINDKDNLIDYIEIPKPDEKSIINLYIKDISENYPKIKNKFSKISDNKNIFNDFHTIINNLDLYEEYIDFKINILLKIASEWCESINISYTYKIVK